MRISDWSSDVCSSDLAIAYVADHAMEVKKFHFMPVGLWSEDATLRFYAPRDPTHVSHSIVNLQETESYFEARCRRIASLMAELGHDRPIGRASCRERVCQYV